MFMIRLKFRMETDTFSCRERLEFKKMLNLMRKKPRIRGSYKQMYDIMGIPQISNGFS